MILFRYPFWVLLFLGPVVQAHEPDVVDLTSLSWTLSNPDGSVSVPATFPSQAHLDLIAAGVIPDPYIGNNQTEVLWVAMSNWTYSAVIPEIPSDTTPFVVFDGLDTFATVRLCDHVVGVTENQFRQYSFDLSEALDQCTDSRVLSIEFASAIEVANNLADRPDRKKWADGIQGVFEFPNREFVRKQQNDFGWDWGPALVPAGPWLPGRLVFMEKGQIHVTNTLVDIHFRNQHNLVSPNRSEHWVIDIGVDYIGILGGEVLMNVRLTDAQDRVVKQVSIDNLHYGLKRISGSFNLTNGFVDLWWPTDMGTQTLYDLSIDIVEPSFHPLAAIERRVGFRTVVLKYHVISQHDLQRGVAPGSHWYFEVNGREFYAKGSNFIPPDAFWPRVRPSKIRRLLEDAKESNLNMLRIWSSGAYLPDYFYSIADELGLLIWSEFQFSDALYPVDPDFLENVRREAEYQVRRLNYHPSLAVWAGGNEMENLELRLVKQISPKDYDRAVEEYETLFIHTLAREVFNNSKSISYMPSSSGKGFLAVNLTSDLPITPRYKSDNPKEIHGSTDYYNYNVSQAFDASQYPVGRFAVEFGFHSMPSIESLEQVLHQSSFQHLNSTNILQRTKHYPAGKPNSTDYTGALKGAEEMISAVKTWYPTPMKHDRVEQFATWCLATQVFQADFVRSQIQHYRRGISQAEHQRGALYWQLNDVWQGPSWSGIEYDGRWKPVQYIAKEEFKHVTSSFVYDKASDTVEVFLTSTSSQIELVQLKLSFMEWNGRSIRANITGSSEPVVHFLEDDPESVRTVLFMQPLSSKSAFKFSPRETIALFRPESYVIRAEAAVIPTTTDLNSPMVFKSQPDSHVAWFHPLPLSQTPLLDPQIKVRLEPVKDEDMSDGSRSPYKHQFVVEAPGGVATWVWLNYERLRRIVVSDYDSPQKGINGTLRSLHQTQISVFDEIDEDTDRGVVVSTLDRLAQEFPQQAKEDLSRAQRQQIHDLIALQEYQMTQIAEQHRALLLDFQSRQADQLATIGAFLSGPLLDQFKKSMDDQGILFEQLEEQQLLQLRHLHEQQLYQLKQAHKRQMQDLFEQAELFRQRPEALSFQRNTDAFSPEAQARIDDLLAQQRRESAELEQTQKQQLVELEQKHLFGVTSLKNTEDILLAEARRKLRGPLLEMFEEHVKQQMEQLLEFQATQKTQLQVFHKQEALELERKHRSQLEILEAQLVELASRVRNLQKRQVFVDVESTIRELVAKQQEQTRDLIGLQQMQIAQLSEQQRQLLSQLQARQDRQFQTLQSRVSPQDLAQFRAECDRQLARFQQNEGMQLNELQALHQQQLTQLDGLQQRQIQQLREDLSQPLPVDLQARLGRLRRLQQIQRNELAELHSQQVIQLSGQHQQLTAQIVRTQQKFIAKVGPTVPPFMLDQIRAGQRQQLDQFQIEQQQQLQQLRELHRRQQQELAEAQQGQIQQAAAAGRSVVSKRATADDDNDGKENDDKENHDGDEGHRDGPENAAPVHRFPTRVHFLDNGFWLRPGERRAVKFVAYRSESKVAGEELPLSVDAFISPTDVEERVMSQREVADLSAAGWMKRVKVTSVWDWIDR